MTLLTICQDASPEIGIKKPSNIIGVESVDTRRLLRYANRVGLYLMRTAVWQALRKEQTFTSIAGETQTGILPSDFDRFVPETFWNRSDNYLIAGPISAVEWAGFKALENTDPEPKFAHRGDSILLSPVLVAGKSLAFEYVSTKWCQSSASVAQTAWTADSDTALLDEEMFTLGIIYMYRAGRGAPNAAIAKQEFDDYCDIVLGNDQPRPGILAAADIFGNGRRFTGIPAVGGTYQ